MENRNGLADRTRFEAFSRQWRDAVLEEAGKWCSDERAEQLLADAVLTDFRKKFAGSDPPVAMEYFIRGQVCLVFGVTGGKAQKLEKYIAEQAFPEEPEAAEKAAAAQTEAPEKVATAQTEAPEKAAAAQTEAPEKVAAAQTEAPEREAAPSEPRPAPQEGARAALPAAPVPDAPPAAGTAPVQEMQAEARPDTFLDPVRTTFWTPDSERNEHVVKEVELLDEEESERSVAISFLNTILFLVTAGAFAFCFYETGFLQYLLQ